jgi:hypothetical protein
MPAGTISSIPNDPDFIATVKTYAVVEPILNELIASRPPSFAEVFSQVLGRPIAYVGITPEQAEQGMKARSMPDWLVAHLVAGAKFGAAGAFSTENTKLIEDLVGRAPITTKQFVEDFKAAFS